LSHDDSKSRMAVENAGENETGNRLKQLNAGRLFRETGCHGDDWIAGAAVAFIDRCSFNQDCEVKTDRNADLLRSHPEWFPRVVINGRGCTGSEDVDVT